MIDLFERLLNKPPKNKGPTQPKPNAKAYSPKRNRAVKQDAEILSTTEYANHLAGLQWFEVLDVNPRTANISDVRKAFRKKISQCHPDKLVGRDPVEIEKLNNLSIALNRAYTQAKRIVV